MPEGRRFEGVGGDPRKWLAPNSLTRVISRPAGLSPPPMPPNGVGGTRRPPCASSGLAAFMEGWLPSRDSGCVPRSSGRPGGGTGGRRDRGRHGQLDASFNGGAPRIGTNAQGLAWSTQSVRVSAVVQADGRIVVAGQRAGAATLARFNANGTLDTTYGTAASSRRASPARRRASRAPRRPPRSRSIPPVTCSRPDSVPPSRCSSRASRRRRHDCERRLLRAAPDRLHGLRDRRAPGRQRRTRARRATAGTARPTSTTARARSCR